MRRRITFEQAAEVLAMFASHNVIGKCILANGRGFAEISETAKFAGVCAGLPWLKNAMKQIDTLC